MKQLKKLLSILLAAMLLVGLLPTAAYAAGLQVAAASFTHSVDTNSEWLGQNVLQAMSSKGVQPDINSIIYGTNLSELSNVDLSVSSNDMPENYNGAPFFMDANVSTRKWVLTGLKYNIQIDNDIIEESTLTLEQLAEKSWEFDINDHNVPENATTVIVTFTYYWDVADATDVPITLTYNFNTAAAGAEVSDGQIPANAKIYGIEKDSGNLSANSVSPTNVEKSMASGSTVTVGEIGTFYDQYEQLLAISKDENGGPSYYQLTGWMYGDTQLTDGKKVALKENTTFHAQWKKIMSPEMAKTEIENRNLPDMKLSLTTSQNALIEQKSTSMTEFTSEKIAVDKDGKIFYQATVYMDPVVAGFLGGKVVSNPNFAKFDVTVKLDPSLKLVSDDSGNVTFQFTCPFLKPTGVTVKGKSVEATISDNGSPYTITVAANALSSESGTALPFVVSAEWSAKGTASDYKPYTADELEEPMTLKAETAIASMTDYSKEIQTTGEVNGTINFVAGISSVDGKWYSNGIQEYDLFTIALGVLNTVPEWESYYKEEGFVALLAAIETLRTNNLSGKIDANTVEAVYPNPNTITATAGTGGTITPSGSVQVEYGSDQTFTIKANSGYTITDVIVDGQSKGAISTYTFKNVQDNHTINATFRRTGGGGVVTPTQYTITAEAGDGGSISPSGKVRVDRGDDQTFRITPDDGYEIADVLVDGKSVGAVSRYTFENVRASHTIEVVFERTGSAVADPDDTGVSDWLNTEDHNAYLSGYPGSLFGPDNNMTRAEVAQMFYNLLLDKDVAVTVTFDDIPADAWYAEAVNTLASLGMITGVGNNQFEPERSITRAEFTTIAMRFTDGALDGENIFPDVNPNDWFYDYVVGSIQYGWINGYPDGTFGPNDSITRAEVTTITNRMLGRSADEAFVDSHQDSLVQFGDITDRHWAYYQVMEATNGHDYTKTDGVEDWSRLN